MALDRPVFWLGIAGLSPQQRAELVAFLPGQPTSLPAWRVAKFSEADAWCVNGAAAHWRDDGTLVVPDSRRAGPLLTLSLAEVDRPLAFTTPLTSPDVAPLTTFDPSSERAIYALLKKFETYLQPLRVQYFLGALLHQSMDSLQRAVYGVVHQSVLLAVVDFPKRQIDYLEDASPVQLEQAQWVRRNPEVDTVPERFKRAGLVSVMWQFAQHSAAYILPAGYATESICLRHLPQVPAHWLKESQHAVLRGLARGPCSFAQLQKSGVHPEQLVRDLASLYFAGAVGTVAGDLPWLSSAHARLSGPGTLS